MTVVEAKHAQAQLDEHHEAQEQVGFADRILVSKADLITEAEYDKLLQRLKQINPRASKKKVHFGETEISDILDIRGFSLEAILEIEPEFLQDVSHEHDDEVTSFVYRDSKPFDFQKLEAFLGLLVDTFGVDMLRYKGILNIEGAPTRRLGERRGRRARTQR